MSTRDRSLVTNDIPGANPKKYEPKRKNHVNHTKDMVKDVITFNYEDVGVLPNEIEGDASLAKYKPGKRMADRILLEQNMLIASQIDNRANPAPQAMGGGIRDSLDQFQANYEQKQQQPPAASRGYEQHHQQPQLYDQLNKSRGQVQPLMRSDSQEKVIKKNWAKFYGMDPPKTGYSTCQSSVGGIVNFDFIDRNEFYNISIPKQESQPAFQKPYTLSNSAEIERNMAQFYQGEIDKKESDYNANSTNFYGAMTPAIRKSPEAIQSELRQLFGKANASAQINPQGLPPNAGNQRNQNPSTSAPSQLTMQDLIKMKYNFGFNIISNAPNPLLSAHLGNISKTLTQKNESTHLPDNEMKFSQNEKQFYGLTNNPVPVPQAQPPGYAGQGSKPDVRAAGIANFWGGQLEKF